MSRMAELHAEMAEEMEDDEAYIRWCDEQMTIADVEEAAAKLAMKGKLKYNLLDKWLRRK